MVNMTDRREPNHVRFNMAPMIDVVFQLLIFFMLTLKIVAEEGDFNINMPIGSPPVRVVDKVNLADIKVRLRADPRTGQLAEILYGQTRLGNGPESFERLNAAILRSIGGKPGRELSKHQKVEIKADYNLNYRHVIRAVSACSGRMENGELVRYIEQIRFAPPVRSS